MAYELIKLEWDEIASQHLAECTGPGYGLQEMEIEVTMGIGELYGAFYEGNRFASCILRKDGDELVVVAAGGETKEQSTFKSILPLVKKVALDKNLTKLRAHTFKQSTVRLMEMCGWEQSEFVLRQGV